MAVLAETVQSALCLQAMQIDPQHRERDRPTDRRPRHIITRHVLTVKRTNNPPPATTPFNHGQQLYKELSHSSYLWKVIKPRNKFSLCVNCDLDLGNMTLSEGHNTNVLHIMNINMTVISYGSDTDVGYKCTVTLTFEIWPTVKVMPHPWARENNGVKYYQGRTWQWGVEAQTPF